LQEGTIIKNNPFKGKDCFNCGEVGHISINCSNKKEDKYGKKKDKKNVHKKKKYYKKEKNGQSYFVEWDSDASSHEDDDDKPSKGLAGVAIK
jgi:poly(3-hydroxyalkanoate) synthetase